MKKLTALFLALALCLSLCTVTAFAGKAYDITNGTTESDKEKNHGYITIDKTSETVTITVYPEEDYELKSLTVVPTGFVDLGIKDAQGKSLYWGETNLGASNPQDPGDYYMWGATALMYSSKTDGVFTFKTENPYGIDNYKNTWDASLGFHFNNVPFANGVFKNNVGEKNVFTKYTTSADYAKSGIPDNITTLESKDDAATARNANWHTPTYDEFVALATKCVLVWTSDYNSTGNAGYIVYKAKKDADKGKVNMNGTWKMWDAAQSKYIDDTGSAPTGYSTSDIHIFLPAAGYGNDTKLLSKNTAGAYCSSDLNETYNHLMGAVNFNKSGFTIAYNYFRNYGFSIRPVMNFSGITPAPQEGGTYQFTMPGYDVTVTAVFERTGGGNHHHGGGYSAPSGHLVTSDLTSVTKVTVDGKAVDSKYYTVSGGNVTLTDAFMKTLANGKHTVKLYNGDVVATGTMTVSGNAAVVSAKTADAGIALYGVLSVSSLLGMGWVSKKRK